MPQRFSAAVGAANELWPAFIGPDKCCAEERITLGIGPVEDRRWFELKKSSLVALDFRDALDLKPVRREFESALRQPFLSIGKRRFCRFVLGTCDRRQDVNKAKQNR